jgi:hypothetical protein
MNATIGADPEMFVKRGQTILPIFGLVGGTKKAPLPILLGAPGFTYQEDGAALEFNIPAFMGYTRFTEGIGSAMENLQRYILNPLKLEIATGINAIKLTSEQLEHPKAKEIGCLPDHWAYGAPGDSPLPEDMYKRKPFSASDLGAMRYAGGHIHVGYNKEAVPADIFAKYMDVLIGLPCVKYDKQGGRRKIYGLPGLYRPKPYGLEYRTLSNFWLFGADNVRQNISNNIIDFAKRTYSDEWVRETLHRSYTHIPWADVAAAITNEDEVLANSLVRHISDTMQLGGDF